MLNTKMTIYRLVRYWFIPALLATVIFGTIYATNQQTIRQQANDPQIQIAQDIAYKMENGQSAQSMIPSDKIDLTSSLANFVIIYNESGQPVNSSVQLDREIPTIPSGVLQTAKDYGQNTLTWEPKTGVRVAAVIVHFSGQNSGYILSGRSLRETERREARISYISVAGWLISLLLIFLVSIFIPDKSLYNTSKPSSDVLQPKENGLVETEANTQISKSIKTAKPLKAKK